MLQFYRRMIAFRKAHEALAKGGFELVAAEADRLSFIRADGAARVFCAFNLSARQVEMALPPGDWQQDHGAPFRASQREGAVMLPPYQAFFGLDQATGTGKQAV